MGGTVYVANGVGIGKTKVTSIVNNIEMEEGKV